VQYTSIIAEHLTTRSAVGIADISHMGRLRFEGPGAAVFLAELLTRRVADMELGQIRYSLVTNDAGGILDDVLVGYYRNAHGQPFMGERTVPIASSQCAPPSNATAYVFNATVVPSGVLPYLTLWPDTELQPTVSTLNAYDGFVTSNMAIVPNLDGSIDAYAAGLTQLILDISGYFAP